MGKMYRLEDFRKSNRILSGNSFTERDIDLIHLTADSDELPKEITEKVDSMINNIIENYEEQERHKLDIEQLEIDARLLISTANPEHKPESSIDVTIMSGEENPEEILIYDEFIVLPETAIHEVFKRYFMKRLEEILFEEIAS